ncbi:hypothetical protein [Chryseobacterium aureum]|uniref:hypothetical protein n=1 Tax=Chryseobacterium aureum TaxID=2497456 RepID=UPI000F89AAEE|nr:hypothetical protein [Chryseobacterium aureum]
MKTKYIKVSVSDRLPETAGNYYIINSIGTKQIEYFNGRRLTESFIEPEYWLQEVPDYEDEMKEMLDELIHVKDDILQALDHANNSAEDYQYLFDKAKSILTKLKTES